MPTDVDGTLISLGGTGFGVTGPVYARPASQASVWTIIKTPSVPDKRDIRATLGWFSCRNA